MTNVLTQTNKKAVILITAIAFAISMVLGFALASPNNANAANTDEKATKRTINVSGMASIKVTPDIAYVSLGVITEDKNALTAQKENAKKMSAVIAKIKASGIKSEDIKTVNYYISPKYDYNKETGQSNIVGYTVNNTVQVTVRDLNKTGNIIDIASDEGVNSATGISFGLSDNEKYYNQALEKAVKNAQKKAETMASVYGIKLKMPVTITENSGYTPIYTMRESFAKASADFVNTPVEAGNLEVSANVSIVYEY